MKTYVYETIPQGCCEEPRHYEIEQEDSASPLTQHPETGEPIRRVVLGGVELVKESGSCGCGPEGCC